MRRVTFLVSTVCVLSLLLTTIGAAAPAVGPGARAPLGAVVRTASADLQTLCKAGGKLYGAGQGHISLLNEDGSVQARLPSPVQSVAGISAFQAGKLVLGDKANKGVLVYDLESKRATPLFRLSEISRQGFAAGSVLDTGELASVASDGKNIFLGLKAGFSSSIFVIDPSGKRILAHGWAPGDDPSAMAFEKGRLFVLDGKGRQLRSFGPDLKPNYRWQNVPVQNPLGVVIEENDARVIGGSARNLATARVNYSTITRASQLILQTAVTPIDITSIVASIPRKYAVLICGDVAESGAAFNCFWNDTYWMYQALQAKGFSKANIYVLYGNGNDWACPNPRYKPPAGEKVTDFPATMSWVTKVLDGLKNGDAANGIAKMDDNDTLFVWTFDHGAGGSPAYLCLMDGWYKDSDFATKLNAIPCAKRYVFMQQCRSGGFIDNLTSTKTFISTACKSTENAYVGNEYEVYSGVTYTHGEYNYHIISALWGATPTGAPINADSNGNGKVSVREMHNWEVGHEDSTGETPQVDDPGGIGLVSHLAD